MPQSLARKRVWNKKYPICIELAKQDDFMSKAQGERPEAGEEKSTVQSEKVEKTDKGEKAEGSASAEEPKKPTFGGGDLTIYLFGRTGREKEEWFRRFLLASRMKSEGRGGSLPSICKNGELHTLPDQGANTHTRKAFVIHVLSFFLFFTHLYLHRHAPFLDVRIAVLLSRQLRSNQICA